MPSHPASRCRLSDANNVRHYRRRLFSVGTDDGAGGTPTARYAFYSGLAPAIVTGRVQNQQLCKKGA